jgi:hypothetical protein
MSDRYRSSQRREAIREIRDRAREEALAGKIPEIPLLSGASIHIRREGNVFRYYLESKKKDRSDVTRYIREVRSVEYY